MKKLSLLFLIVIVMAASLVSCSPDSSSESDESTLLLGEVIPPSESDRVTATDEEIKILNDWLDTNYDIPKSSEKIERELDYGSDGKLTLVSEDGKITQNGQITVDGVVYKFDNLVVSAKSNGDSASTGEIISGSVYKDGVKMSNEDISKIKIRLDDNVKSYTDKTTVVYKGDIKDDSGKVIGSGTEVEVKAVSVNETTKYHSLVKVYDLTVEDNRVQLKMSGTEKCTNPESKNYDKEYKVDYLALNGRFFDEASIDRLDLIS